MRNIKAQRLPTNRVLQNEIEFLPLFEFRSPSSFYGSATELEAPNMIVAIARNHLPDRRLSKLSGGSWDMIYLFISNVSANLLYSFDQAIAYPERIGNNGQTGIYCST